MSGNMFIGKRIRCLEMENPNFPTHSCIVQHTNRLRVFFSEDSKRYLCFSRWTFLQLFALSLLIFFFRIPSLSLWSPLTPQITSVRNYKLSSVVLFYVLCSYNCVLYILMRRLKMNRVAIVIFETTNYREILIWNYWKLDGRSVDPEAVLTMHRVLVQSRIVANRVNLIAKMREDGLCERWLFDISSGCTYLSRNYNSQLGAPIRKIRLCNVKK